jgi:hypothetical protein
MSLVRWTPRAALCGVLMLQGCTELPTRLTETNRSGAPAFDLDAGIVLSANGGGKMFVNAPPIAAGEADFSFTAVQSGDGRAAGQFHMVRPRAGLMVEFEGTVTCLSVDPILGRAWIGGVVTKNRSTDPVFQTAIHEVGDDVWFRVADNGEGAGAAPDRSSVYGFEGAGGVTTSAEYCALQLWAAGDVNTFPQTMGNIQVRAR